MSAIRYLGIFTFLIILLFPLYWMFKGSFENTRGIIRMPPSLVPSNPSLENYKMVFLWDYTGGAATDLQLVNFIWPVRWALNTLIILSIKLGMVLVVCGMAAYAFSMYEFRFKRTLFIIFIASMVLPPVMLVPSFVMIKKIGLYGSRWGMILGGAYNSAIMYILKNYIDTIPREIIESARLEGAGEARVLWRIILPLCKPALGVGVVISTMDTLRDYIWGMMILPAKSQYTLMVGIMRVIGYSESVPGGNSIGLTLAGGVVNFMPLLIIFVLCQRHFIRGMQIGGVKG